MADDWKVVIGFLAGCFLAYIIFQALHRTTITELTRDSEGRLITILEKSVW